jgi:hypothetical protein
MVKVLGGGLEFAPPLGSTTRRRTLKTLWPPFPEKDLSSTKPRRKSLELIGNSSEKKVSSRRSLFDNGKIPLSFRSLGSKSRNDQDRADESKNDQVEEKKLAVSLEGMNLLSNTKKKGFQRVSSEKLQNEEAEDEEHLVNSNDETQRKGLKVPPSPRPPTHIIFTEEKYPDIYFPSGQQLPPQKGGAKKFRRTNYRIRYDGPTTLNFDMFPLMDIPEQDDRFRSQNASGALKIPIRRTGLPRMPGRRYVYNDDLPSRPRRSHDDDSEDFSVDHDDNCLPSDYSADLAPKQKVNSRRPDVWMTPLDDEDKQEKKWMVKRVWYAEEKDERETKYTVDQDNLHSSIRKLFGSPTDKEGDGDSNAAQWYIQKIYDIEGEQSLSELEVQCTEMDMKKEIQVILEEADQNSFSGTDKHNDDLAQAPDLDNTSLALVNNEAGNDDTEERNTDHSLNSSPLLNHEPVENVQKRFLEMVMPSRQKLPPPKGRKKGRSTYYQIRYKGPTLLQIDDIYGPLLDIPEEDNRFESEMKNGGMKRPMREMGPPRRPDRGSTDAMPSRPRRSLEDDGYSLDDDEMDHRGPDIWMKLIQAKNPKEDQKWKVKRVWNLEGMDEKEEEHTVHNDNLLPTIRYLFGLPVEDASEAVCLNGVINDDDKSAPFYMKRVYHYKGEIEEIQIEVQFNAKEMENEMNAIKKESKNAPRRKKYSRKAKTTTTWSPDAGRSSEKEKKALRILPWEKKANVSKKQEEPNKEIKMWWWEE